MWECHASIRVDHVQALVSDMDADHAYTPCEMFFPDVAPGCYDPLTGRWRKPASTAEERVYQTVQHERILKYFNTRDGYLELAFHPDGDLWTYLLDHRPPLGTRIEWAVEIAEGLAHLHSHSIVWADAHFRNVLVTQDHHIVLCDFAFSLSKPGPCHQFTTAPPPIFLAPWGYYGRPATHVDIFGFGVMLFALLANRFPWTTDLLPDADAQSEAAGKHGRRQFDTMDDPYLGTHFGGILEKCFAVSYATGTELLDDMKRVLKTWCSTTHQAMSLAKVCHLT
ncbi:kinase domain-containing protein [Favolaschia claudopus]|uniref:Kinase domain-containing protein n=1 Tax=Favolaschia claudopus TaxID=2862362 RepID=A0AAV9Z5L8_9AGAR